MATARLRKAFRYPQDDENEPTEMDEEQQEKLIADLQRHDEQNTRIYTTAFTSMLAGATLYFLFLTLTAGSSFDALIPLLELVSVALTTTLFLLEPPEAPDKKGKKPVYLIEQQKSSITAQLSYAAMLCSGLSFICAINSWWKGSHNDAMRQALAPVIYALMMYVRQLLRPLAWQELQQARYELKGA